MLTTIKLLLNKHLLDFVERRIFLQMQPMLTTRTLMNTFASLESYLLNYVYKIVFQFGSIKLSNSENAFLFFFRVHVIRMYKPKLQQLM